MSSAGPLGRFNSHLEQQSNRESGWSHFPFLWVYQPLSAGCPVCRKHLTIVDISKSISPGSLRSPERNRHSYGTIHLTHLNTVLPIPPSACKGSLSGLAQRDTSASEVSETTVLEVWVHFTQLSSVVMLKASHRKKVSSLIPPYTSSFHIYLTSSTWKAIIPACSVVKWMKCFSLPHAVTSVMVVNKTNDNKL